MWGLARAELKVHPRRKRSKKEQLKIQQEQDAIEEKNRVNLTIRVKLDPEEWEILEAYDKAIEKQKEEARK